MTIRTTPGGPDLAAAVSALCDTARVQVDRDPVAVKAAHAAAIKTARESGTSSRDIDAVMAAYRELKRAASKWADRPSLLSQLRQAVQHGSEGQERAGGGAGAPIRPDALDLIDRLRGTVRDALDLLGLPARRVDDPTLDPIHGDLRRLVVASWPGVEGAAARARLTRRLDHVPTDDDPGAPGFVQRVRALLDPDPGSAERSARDTPCPVCSALSVVELRDGERQPAPALRLDLVAPEGAGVRVLRGVSCRACGHYVWRETDEHGQPTGAFADLRDSARAYHDALAEWAAGSRAADRAAREAREAGAKHGVPHLDLLAAVSYGTHVDDDGGERAEVVTATFTYEDGSRWGVVVSRRVLETEPRRSA